MEIASLLAAIFAGLSAVMAAVGLFKIAGLQGTATANVTSSDMLNSLRGQLIDINEQLSGTAAILERLENQIHQLHSLVSEARDAGSPPRRSALLKPDLAASDTPESPRVADPEQVTPARPSALATPDWVLPKGPSPNRPSLFRNFDDKLPGQQAPFEPRTPMPASPQTTAPAAAIAPLPETFADIAQPVPDDRSPPVLADDPRVAALIDQYRDLVSQPSRVTIRDWLATNNAITADAIEADIVAASTEPGLIALIKLTDQRAILLPSARFVVDFATRYAENLALRQATRDVFEPVIDNASTMRLVEPAVVHADSRGWIVIKPGKIGGFKA